MITFKGHACCPLKLVKHLLETDYETAYCKIIMVVPLPPTQGGVTATIKLRWEQVDHIVLADWQSTSIIILDMNNNLIFTTNALRYVRYKSLIMNVSMVSHSFPFVFIWLIWPNCPVSSMFTREFIPTQHDVRADLHGDSWLLQPLQPTHRCLYSLSYYVLN